jgi:hypothetical protein
MQSGKPPEKAPSRHRPGPDHDPFDGQAKAYASYRPTYPAALYAFILQHVRQRRIAWDCGTGSGQVASHLSNYFDKVCATDKSAGQLQHAVRRDNIEYIHGGAEATEFPPDYFDLVTVAQAIHWFDFDRFYEEVRRGSLSDLAAAYAVEPAPRGEIVVLLGPGPAAGGGPAAAGPGGARGPGGGGAARGGGGRRRRGGGPGARGGGGARAGPPPPGTGWPRRCRSRSRSTTNHSR